MWTAVRLSRDSNKDIIWDITTPEGLEQALGRHVPLVRDAHLNNICSHIMDCPRCLEQLSLTLDGKTAKRRICVNMDGFEEYPDLKVKVQSGCKQHASSYSLYCRSCSKHHVHAPIPQIPILKEVVEEEDGLQQLFYLVQCHDLDDESAPFDARLPRSEVLPHLLRHWEVRFFEQNISSL